MAAVALVALALASAAPAAAQSPHPALDSMEVSVVRMPIWYEPGDSLRLRLRVTNSADTPLEELRIRVGVRDRALSRSALAQTYETPPGFESSTLPIAIEGRLDAQSSRVIEVDEAIESFPTLATAIEGGVFPTTISVQEPTGATTFASLTVPLIYYPEVPEVPLNVSVLLPLNEVPAAGPDGHISEEALEGALGERGWLSAYVDALQSAVQPPRPGRRRAGTDPLALALGPTPRLIEELAFAASLVGDDASPLAEEAGRVLRGLRSLLEGPQVEPVLVPYAFPDLPSTIESLPLGHTIEQFAEAQEVWRDELGLEFGGDWVFPPAGRVDAPSLEQLQLLGHGGNLFFAANSFEPLPINTGGCPEPFLSFTCAVRVETGGGESIGLVADEGLSDFLLALRGRTNDRLGLQHVFAETAMIHEELPGTEGRVIQATIPATWQPGPAMARILFRGLRRAPWLRSTSASDAIELAGQTETRDMTDGSEPVESAPAEGFYDEVEEVRELLESYRSVVPPNNPRARRLRRNVLVATSRSWWGDIESAEHYVTQTSREVHAEMEKVGLTGASDVTLTSREGQLQIVLSNETDYPMRLALRLISPDISFPDDRIVDTYPPGNRPLTLSTIARGSGVFPVSVRLESPDGRIFVDEKRIVVRSTSFNQVALGLTVGAFAFLVLFYLFKAFRRQRDTETDPPTELS